MAHAANIIAMPTPPTREEVFLHSVRDAGNWTRVALPALRLLIDTWYAQRVEGEEVPEMIAELDLIYGADRRDIRAVRYYAKRWGWDRGRTYRYLKARGLNREDAAPKRGTTAGQERDSRGTETLPNGKESTPNGTAVGQERDKGGTVSPDSDSGELKKDAREEVPEGWTEETLPILTAWRECSGDAAIPPMVDRTIRLLLQPAGGMNGARIPGKTEMFNGYTPADIVRGIEDLHLSAHHSPESLVKHVAGLITPRVDRTLGNGTNGSSGGKARSPLSHAAYCELSEFHRRDYAQCYDREGRVHWHRTPDGIPDGFTKTRPTTGANA